MKPLEEMEPAVYSSRPTGNLLARKWQTFEDGAPSRIAEPVSASAGDPTVFNELPHNLFVQESKIQGVATQPAVYSSRPIGNLMARKWQTFEDGAPSIVAEPVSASAGDPTVFNKLPHNLFVQESKFQGVATQPAVYSSRPIGNLMARKWQTFEDGAPFIVAEPVSASAGDPTVFNELPHNLFVQEIQFQGAAKHAGPGRARPWRGQLSSPTPPSPTVHVEELSPPPLVSVQCTSLVPERVEGITSELQERQMPRSEARSEDVQGVFANFSREPTLIRSDSELLLRGSPRRRTKNVHGALPREKTSISSPGGSPRDTYTAMALLEKAHCRVRALEILTVECDGFVEVGMMENMNDNIKKHGNTLEDDSRSTCSLISGSDLSFQNLLHNSEAPSADDPDTSTVISGVCNQDPSPL